MAAISDFLVEDHRRIEALLAQATEGRAIDLPAFERFRAALLRHIGMEEKILFLAAKEARGGEPLPAARELRIQHSAIAALLVPTPTAEIAAEVRGLLDRHDALEEGAAGVYAECDRLLAEKAESILDRMRAAPEVPLARHFDGKGVYRTAEEALRAFSNKR